MTEVKTPYEFVNPAKVTKAIACVHANKAGLLVCGVPKQLGQLLPEQYLYSIVHIVLCYWYVLAVRA